MAKAKQAIVRKAVLADADTVAHFNIQLALETETLQLDPATVNAGVRQVLADPNKGNYYIAEVDGQVVGQLMITLEWSDWRNGWIWWIQSVYVHSDFRKRGIFNQIFDFCQADAIKNGVVLLRLYVERENVIAQKTYARLGLADAHYHVFEKKI